MSFENCKIYRTSEKTMRGDTDKISLKSLDIPLINFDNAILYVERDGSYRRTFNISILNDGLMSHEGQYYWFEHNIVACPRGYLSSSQTHSYDIYPIREDLANRIIKDKKAFKLEIHLHCLYYYGEQYLSSGTENYSQKYKYVANVTHGDDGDSILIPFSRSSSKMSDGITIGKLLSDTRVDHPHTDISLKENKSVIRESLLNMLL